jgi:hypothetical protein
MSYLVVSSSELLKTWFKQNIDIGYISIVIQLLESVGSNNIFSPPSLRIKPGAVTVPLLPISTLASHMNSYVPG